MSDITKKIDESLRLLDTYGNLLTDKQREFFRYVYEDDLSFSEIAENEGISKAAVSDLVKRTTTILNDYEAKLQLIAKANKRNMLLDELEEHPEKVKEIVIELHKIDEVL